MKWGEGEGKENRRMKTAAVIIVEEEDNPEVQEEGTVEEERYLHWRRRSRVTNVFPK